MAAELPLPAEEMACQDPVAAAPGLVGAPQRGTVGESDVRLRARAAGALLRARSRADVDAMWSSPRAACTGAAPRVAATVTGTDPAVVRVAHRVRYAVALSSHGRQCSAQTSADAHGAGQEVAGGVLVAVQGPSGGVQRRS